MSNVTSRSTKAALYSEIERLRELCDWQEQQLNAQRDELAQLRAQLRAQREEAPQPSERRTKLEDLKAFATKFRCATRLRDGVIELYSRKRQCWVAVPEGVQP